MANHKRKTHVPDTIYLQIHEEEETSDFFSTEGVTWCEDRTDDIDIEYVRSIVLLNRDTELAILREALDTIPIHEYGEALRAGCGTKDAWDCFREALREHIAAVRSCMAVYDKTHEK